MGKIIFLPWFIDETDTTIGNIKFWSYWSFKCNYINDENIKKMCNNFFSKFRIDINKKANPVVISYIKNDKSEMFIEENYYENVRKAVPIFTFIHLASSFINIPPLLIDYSACSDYFIVMQADIGYNGYTILPGGRKLEVYTKNQSKGKYYYRPDYIPLNEKLKYENYLKEAFDEGLKLKNNHQFNKIINSIDMFNHAHSYSYFADFQFKIVLLATAFEILLDIGKGHKSIKLAEKIGHALGKEKGENIYSRIVNKRTGERRRFFRKQWWAYDFYQLRNVVVHGDEIKDSVFKYKIKHFNRNYEYIWTNHFNLSCYFFRKCIIEKLKDLGFYKDIGNRIREFIKTSK